MNPALAIMANALVGTDNAGCEPALETANMKRSGSLTVSKDSSPLPSPRSAEGGILLPSPCHGVGGHGPTGEIGMTISATGLQRRTREAM